MKSFLLIVGILTIVISVFMLLYAAISFYSYKNLYDAAPEHYRRLHRKSVIFFVTGTVLALTGVTSIIIYTVMQ